MGTNFYWRSGAGELLPLPDDEDARHIGKRSAAGPYCWDCDVTLIVGGNSKIHHSGSITLNNCPKCGAPWIKNRGLSEGPAAIELGFAQPAVTRPTGVRGTSSFSWAQEPERVGAICEKHAEEQIVEDEYGRLLTGREFLDMLLANCAVQFTEWIGQEFS